MQIKQDLAQQGARGVRKFVGPVTIAVQVRKILNEDAQKFKLRHILIIQVRGVLEVKYHYNSELI